MSARPPEGLSFGCRRHVCSVVRRRDRWVLEGARTALSSVYRNVRGRGASALYRSVGNCGHVVVNYPARAKDCLCVQPRRRRAPYLECDRALLDLPKWTAGPKITRSG